MHRASCCLGEVPYCFSRSSVKFQGHMTLKIVELDPNWEFPDCTSSLNSLMDWKWCTKPDSSIEEVPCYLSGSSIKFRGHTGWKIDDSNPTWVRLLGRSQLSNHSDLPCWDHVRPWVVYTRVILSDTPIANFVTNIIEFFSTQIIWSDVFVINSWWYRININVVLSNYSKRLQWFWYYL